TDPAFAGMTVQRWHDGLGVRLTAELNAKPDYYQARFIGIADGGREIVRVDRSAPGGTIRVVADAELQQKGDRDYFQHTIRLHPGEVDISPMELNEEHGVIET